MVNGGIELDVTQELADAKIGPLHVALGVVITLITAFDGYDTFNPAYVIHYVMGPWGLSRGAAGLLVSSGLMGFFAGAIGQGMVSDRLGRRGTLLGGLWIVNVFTVLTALFTTSFWSYCGLRFLTGLGLGVLLPVGLTYINELAPPRISNRFSLWGVTLGWSLGGMLAGLVGVFLTPTYGWQILYWAGALSIPLTLVVHRLLPESPKFLAQHGRLSEVRDLLVKLRPEKQEIYRVASFKAAAGPSTAGTVTTLLSPRYRRTTLTVGATAFLSLFSIFGLTGWIPTVMMQRGETFAASFGFGALMQATSFLGGLTLAEVADQHTQSAPRWIAGWWLIGALAVLSLIIGHGHIFNLAMTAAAGFFVVGGQHVMNNYTALAYDTDVRASGVGMMLGVGRVGAILGPFFVGLLQQATGGVDAVFWSIGLAGLISAVAVGSLRLRPSGALAETVVRTN
jgi:AAHS family 4-hydroxybenzoate transporter-like MFS transporter